MTISLYVCVPDAWCNPNYNEVTITLVPSVYCLRSQNTPRSLPILVTRCNAPPVSRHIRHQPPDIVGTLRSKPRPISQYHLVNNNIWLVLKFLLLRPVRRLNKRHPENFTFFRKLVYCPDENDCLASDKING